VLENIEKNVVLHGRMINNLLPRITRRTMSSGKKFETNFFFFFIFSFDYFI
jgi:hypothetical protein